MVAMQGRTKVKCLHLIVVMDTHICRLALSHRELIDICMVATMVKINAEVA